MSVRQQLVSRTRIILAGDCATSVCLLNPGSVNFPVLIDSAGSEVKYVHDDTFLSRTSEAEILQGPKSSNRTPKRQSAQQLGHDPEKMTNYVAHLWSVPLLSRDEELHHFRKLHFLRYQAAALQSEMSACRGHWGMLQQVEARLEQAGVSRRLLIEANLRLVVSLARKFVRTNLTLDELISVGNTALVNAVDQFDYRRGCRFSTYAYQAIQRSIFGALRSEHRNRDRFSSDDCEACLSLAKDASSSDVAEIQAAEARAEVQQLLSLLSPRERMIVMTRFGMEEGTEPSSFQAIAETIGLSKQRVASIYSEAMSKLRLAINRGKTM